MRDFNLEFADSAIRKYHYEFDTFTRRMLLQRLSPFFKGKSALEIGAYKGVMTRELDAIFEDLTVVEASSELAKDLSLEFPNVNVQAFLIEEWETDRTFSNIFLVHTLEHIENRSAVLERIGQLLDLDGLAFIAVPNGNALSRQLAVAMGLVSSTTAVTDGEKSHGHQVTFNLETLKAQLREAGLTIVHSGGVVLKALSNNQIDNAVEARIFSESYLEACNELSLVYPDLYASIFCVVSKSRI